ncbi:hypothetical protein Nepgr_001489 [Nepenthes gracilis]|uniref:Uncharacterized protein n=1 Tax=Nepenthes gracilis TaxID=150966 RepID=A0AAD3P645_NEPGR|nr:hypothetical protein Nepgr_001489 [Nepenthes gracilis]
MMEINSRNGETQAILGIAIRIRRTSRSSSMQLKALPLRDMSRRRRLTFKSYNPKEDRGSNVLDKSDGKNNGYYQREDSSTVKNPSGGQRYGDNGVFGDNQPSYPNDGKSTNTYFDYNDGGSDTTSGSWSRASQPTVLSSATNDITEAVLLLKKAIQPSPQVAAIADPMYPQPRFMVPRWDAMPETISSDEVQRLYGSLDSSSRAYEEGNHYLFGKSNPLYRQYRGRQNYIGTLDSKGVMVKYNGAYIP